MSTNTTILLELDNAFHEDDKDSVKRMEGRFRAYCRRDLDRDLGSELLAGYEGDLTVTADGLRFWTKTKWVLENSEAVAAALSGAYPEAVVTWTNAWDDEDGGEEETVYRDGKATSIRDMQLVPANLDELMHDLMAALNKRGHERNTNPGVRSAALALVNTYFPEN